MWKITLVDLGVNRLLAMKAIRDLLGISLEETKSLVSRENSLLCQGTREQMQEVESRLALTGARTAMMYFADATEIAKWIPDSLSTDKKSCATCGAPLFIAVPGKTTPEEIRRFAEDSRLPNADTIARDGWTHPGVHCPNGCGFVFVDLDA